MNNQLVDLTDGGRCEACDDQNKCYVCGREDVQLYYAQSGDHTHLVMREGRISKEAHGRLMCEEHYLEDSAALGITKKQLGWIGPMTLGNVPPTETVIVGGAVPILA